MVVTPRPGSLSCLYKLSENWGNNTGKKGEKESRQHSDFSLSLYLNNQNQCHQTKINTIKNTQLLI